MQAAPLPICLVVAAVLTLASCSGGSSDPGAAQPERAEAPSVGSSTTEPADDGPQIVVSVVADSEIPDPVAQLLDQQPGVQVVSSHSIHGATMAQLDELAEGALAEEPDVFVYSGGTNDLPTGPIEMLAGLKERLARYGEQACVVMAVPIFRYERGTDAEVAERTKGTRLLERESASTGAKVASYLDVSLAMDDRGEDFFAEGELGDLHPGEAAYPGIASAIAEQVRACAGT